MADQVARANALRDLHQPGQPVLLANIWDAGTAKLAAAAGFPAVATSSGAVAESLGYPDHEGAPVEQMLAAAARVAAAVTMPVTVDAESGYRLPAEEFVTRLLATGAVGANLEDTDHRSGALVEPARQADYLAAVRAAADRAGVPLVINARVDVFARAGAQGADQLPLVAPALERALAYLDAGADCVYPIVASHEQAVEEFVAGVGGRPVNLICRPGGLSPARAAELGAARVSLATGLWRGMQTWLTGRLTELVAGGWPY